MGHTGQKTRSQGQTLKNPRVRTRGQIFSLILMKLKQNVCLDNISDSFKTGYIVSKTWSLGQVLEKN